jgi:hypothetical protein
MTRFIRTDMGYINLAYVGRITRQQRDYSKDPKSLSGNIIFDCIVFAA